MKRHQIEPVAPPCAEWATLLTASSADDLAPTKQALLERRLASCPGCAAVYAAYRQVDALILSLPIVHPSAQHVEQLEALLTTSLADEQQLKPAGAMPSGAMDGTPAMPAPLLRRPVRVASWLSTLAAVLVVAALVGSALLLFSSRHPSASTGGAEGTLYTISYNNGTVYALDAATGKINWSTPLAMRSSEQFVVTNNIIFATSLDRYLYALKASNGQLLWKRSTSMLTPGEPGGTPLLHSLISDGKTVYIGAGGGIFAWSASDGHSLWHYAPPTQCDLTCDVITTANGLVYTYANGLYALRASDGHVAWHNPRFPASYGSDLFVVKDHLYVVADFAVDVLQPDSGQLLDTIQLPHVTPIMMIAVGDMVFINSGTRDVYAVESSNDTVLWQKHYTGPVQLDTASDGNLYYTLTTVYDFSPTPAQHATPIKVTNNNLRLLPQAKVVVRIYAVFTADGSFRWYWQSPVGPLAKRFGWDSKTQSSQAQWYWQSPAGTLPGIVRAPAQSSHGGLFFFTLSVSDGDAYALHASDGKVAWHTTLPDTWLAPPVLG